MSRKQKELILLIMAGAFLRVAHIDDASIWLDESASLYVATKPWAELFVSAQDYFGGLLYLLQLRLWITCFGRSEFVLRLPSALFSVLCLPLLYQTTRRLLGEHTGAVRAALFATLLMTISPLDIWYAREARMYSQACFLGLLGVYSSLRFRETGAGVFALAYALAGLAGIYTIYSFPLILLAINICFAFGGLGQGRKRRVAWLLAQVAIIVGFLPWLPTLYRHIALVSGDMRTWQALFSTFQVLDRLGLSAEQARRFWPLLFVPTAVALTCLLVWGRRWSSAVRQRLDRPWMAFFWGILPYAGVTMLTTWRPGSSVRQLTLVFPYFIIACAVGIVRVRRGQQLLLSVLLLITGLSSARIVLFMPKEQWREAARFVAAAEQPGDAVLFHAYYVRHAFTYYYQGSAFADAAPSPKDKAALQRLKQSYPRVWLILSHETYEDPAGELVRWFDRNYSLLEEKPLVGIRIRLYERRTRP